MTDFRHQSVQELLEVLASDAPTPGGGTAAAIAGAMGASLAGMVATLTLSREKFAASHDAVRPIGEAATTAREELLALAQKDADAYEAVVAARRLPKETDEQKQERSRRITEATRHAAEVPMQTASVAVRMLEALPELVEKGNPSAASDAGAAALLLEAAVEAALLNVGVNLAGSGDAEFVSRMQKETADLQVEAQRLRAHVLAAVRKRF